MLTAIPGVVFTYAILYCHQTNKPGVCSIAHEVDVVPIRKLYHVPRGAPAAESSMEGPGFCSSEDVQCVNNNSCWKGWERRGNRRKEKKNILPRQVGEGPESSGGVERQV